MWCSRCMVEIVIYLSFFDLKLQNGPLSSYMTCLWILQCYRGVPKERKDFAGHEVRACQGHCPPLRGITLCDKPPFSILYHYFTSTSGTAQISSCYTSALILVSRHTVRF
jgi:hypothetical protein